MKFNPKTHKVIKETMDKEEAQAYIDFLCEEWERHVNESYRLVGLIHTLIEDGTTPFRQSALNRHLQDIEDIDKLIPKVKAKFGIAGGEGI